MTSGQSITSWRIVERVRPAGSPPREVSEGQPRRGLLSRERQLQVIDDAVHIGGRGDERARR
jgi:hypothetical protein